MTKKTELSVAFLMSLCFIFSVSYFTGALFSGHHFTEDYEYFEIQDHLASGEGVLKTIVEYTRKDYQRIRIYYAHRVLQTALFGTNVTPMRIQIGLMGALALFFLYLFARSLKASPPASFLFAALSLAGAPMLVWWRMATAENLGMFFLAASLAFMASEPLFILSITLMSFSKESFTVIVPSLLFLKVWLSAENLRLTLWESLKKNAVSLAIVSVATVAQSLFIANVTGTVIAGYVGYEGFDWERFFSTFKQLALPPNALLCAVTAGAVILSAFFGKNKLAVLRKMAVLFIFFFTMTLPIVLLFQKTGIVDNYLLPGVFAFTFFFLYTYQLTKNRLPLWVRAALFLLAGIVLAVHLNAAVKSARVFAEEGKTAERLVETLKEKTNPDDLILIAADPARNLEWSHATNLYLTRLARRKNLYLFPAMRLKYSSFEKYLIYYSPESPVVLYKGRLFGDIKNLQDIRAIVVLPYSGLWFLLGSRKWFDKNAFERIQIGEILVYYKPASGEAIAPAA